MANKPALVILAAGMASRYGSLKQIQGFGPSNETIIDYSIYDAIKAGYEKVVFIIRQSFAEEFKSIFEPKLVNKIQTAYVYQEMDSFTNGYPCLQGRTKPWGTAHAVLCASDVIDGPFAVINADDFYGRNAFEVSYQFLLNDCNDKNFAIVGYDILTTLSDYGTVNRGVCTLNDQGSLASIVERINIKKEGDLIVCNDGAEPASIPSDSRVSMNFWCFDKAYLGYSAGLFQEFLQSSGQELKSEFFIPIVADKFIQEGGNVALLPTSSIWFGVTYKDDAPFVEKSISELIASGEYPVGLWA